MRRQLLRPGTILGAIIAARAATWIGVVAVQRWRAVGEAGEGGIQVENLAEKGSAFRFTLPCQAPAGAGHEVVS